MCISDRHAKCVRFVIGLKAADKKQKKLETIEAIN